jgi:hypothetical protein
LNLAGAVLLDPLSTRANLENEQQVDRELGMAGACNQVLQQLDPRLELVLAKDNATSPHLMPGRWHIIRHNDGPNSYIPITGPNGERIEPSIDMCMRELHKRDMWKPGAVKAIYEAKERKRKRERKEQDAKVDEAVEDAAEVGVYVAKGVAGGRGKEWREFL